MGEGTPRRWYRSLPPVPLVRRSRRISIGHDGFSIAMFLSLSCGVASKEASGNFSRARRPMADHGRPMAWLPENWVVEVRERRRQDLSSTLVVIRVANNEAGTYSTRPI